MSEATYGQQIVAARKELRITQKELAARVGISQQYLCDIEHDRRDVSPSGAVAEAIAYHAGVRSWTPGERALTTRVEELEAAIAALVAGDPIVRYGGAACGCWFCETDESLWAVRPEQVVHSATCPWVRARALLGEKA